MIITARDAETAAIVQVAQLMLAAARTAPKGCGRDLLHSCILTGDDKDQLAAKMAELGEGEERPLFTRDAANLRQAAALVLLGTASEPLGLKRCGLCGHGNCAGCAAAGSHCAFVTGDLGIALGSAVSVAADHRLDNRIMYTAGYAARQLQLLDKSVRIAYGIPLSASGKNPFFDRR